MTGLKAHWERQPDESIREAAAELESFQPDAVEVIRYEAERRGIPLRVELREPRDGGPQAPAAATRKGILRGIFTRENVAVGWSSTWLGLAAGLPLVVLVYAVYPLALQVPLLGAAWLVLVLAPSLSWSWRRIQTGSPLVRGLFAIFVASWIVLCPLNYTFNLSCRRAVRLHRGIEVGTLRYLSGFAGFAIVLGGTWLITGLPLGMLLERTGEPGPAQWALFGMWLLLIPIATIIIFGRLVNDIAERRRSVSDLPTHQRPDATATASNTASAPDGSAAGEKQQRSSGLRP